MAPVLVLKLAPAGKDGLTDQVSGPTAHEVRLADGVIVSVESSSTFCGLPIAATFTVPGLWLTEIENALLLPTSEVAAVAVSVNGPYEPAVPHAGVHVITPVLVLKLAPDGSEGLTDHVSGPAAHVVRVADGVTVSVESSWTLCGSLMAATFTVPVLWLTEIEKALLLPTSPVAAVAVSVNGP
jgi:hypothetical protein